MSRFSISPPESVLRICCIVLALLDIALVFSIYSAHLVYILLDQYNKFDNIPFLIPSLMMCDAVCTLTLVYVEIVLAYGLLTRKSAYVDCYLNTMKWAVAFILSWKMAIIFMNKIGRWFPFQLLLTFYLYYQVSSLMRKDLLEEPSPSQEYLNENNDDDNGANNQQRNRGNAQENNVNH